MESRAELAVGQLLVDFQRRMAELDINFAELARRLGLSRARVSELFSGRQNPTVGTLMKVAEALGCYLRIELAPLALHPQFDDLRANLKLNYKRRNAVLRVSCRPGNYRQGRKYSLQSY
jgi:transcriptional regulator with XRE-family HTH domain